MSIEEDMLIDNGVSLDTGEWEADEEVERLGLPLRPGDGVRRCKRLGRRAATAAEVVTGLGSGGGAQIWSPSSSRGTN